MQIQDLTFDEFEAEAKRLGLELPIEQTRVWSTYEDTVPGRSFWGCLAVKGDDGQTLAVVALEDYQTHGFHFLRGHHGPVWASEPTEDQEREAMVALREHVARRDHKVVFLRIAIKHDLDVSHHTLSTVPYDRTVVIDVTGGDDQILARMKPRGRRDVRKALREAPVTCADETDRAIGDFGEYYAVMRETGERDGFTPAPQSDYQNMISILGPEHCRVFAGRDEDGKVVTWSIVTVSGRHAVRYYAASSNATRRGHVTDKLLYFECCSLGKLDGGRVVDYDLMAIGSELSPSLMGLNEFKTKFTKEVTEVAPDRDLPVRKAFYDLLLADKRVLDKVRGN